MAGPVGGKGFAGTARLLLLVAGAAVVVTLVVVFLWLGLSRAGLVLGLICGVALVVVAVSRIAHSAKRER